METPALLEKHCGDTSPYTTADGDLLPGMGATEDRIGGPSRGPVFQRVGELRGRVSQLPTLIQIIGSVLAIYAGMTAIAFGFPKVLAP